VAISVAAAVGVGEEADDGALPSAYQPSVSSV
jgi:hypothetical protein